MDMVAANMEQINRPIKPGMSPESTRWAHQYVGLLEVKAGQGHERYGVEVFGE